MEFSRNEEVAYKKGYRVTQDGDAIGLRGKRVGFNRQGYYIFKIRDHKNNNRNVKVHRLIAYSKYGDKIYKDGICVRHLDGNPLNNKWSNIEIGSYQDNSLDMDKEVRIKKAIHASSFIKKYDHADVYDFYNETNSYKKTMEEFCISSKGTLFYILNKFKK